MVPAEVAFYDWEKDLDPTKETAKSLINYEKLNLSSDFKNFLLSNLDSDYLISSVLHIGNSTEEDKILLEGINIVNPPDLEKEDEILRQVKIFEDCIAAGVDVMLPQYFLYIFA